MNNIRPFRFWCQKVLPLVYDDSLSYYELLCKVVSKLNEVITNENSLNESFTELKNWVENYFDSTDFQEKVNKKLDEMAKDGTLNEIINFEKYDELQENIIDLQKNLTTFEKKAITSESTDYVGMGQLTEEVKQALTGSSTPVVGVNAVNTSNIVDNAVDNTKISPESRSVYLNRLNSYARLNTENKTLTIKVSGLISGLSFNADEQTLSVPEGNSYIYIDSNNIITLDTNSGKIKTPIGIVSPSNLSMFYGCETYVDGLRIDVPDEYYLAAGLNGAEQYIIFDFNRSKIIMPPLFYIFKKEYNISISNQEDIDMGDFSGLFYNPETNKLFCASSSPCLKIAYFVKSTNLVQCNYPHKIIPNYNAYGAITDEIPMFGDSIVAGAGSGTPFIPLISARSSIRVLNYGVGSSGYLSNPTGKHLMGNGDVNKGTNQEVPTDSTIYGRINANIENINSRYVAIFAGTNDYDQEINNVVDEMIRCCSLIYNNRKIPIIISPIPRKSVNLKPLIDAMESSCITANIPFINMWNIGFHPANGFNLQEYYDDGLHPSKSGHELLATVLAHELKKFSCTDFMCSAK